MVAAGYTIGVHRTVRGHPTVSEGYTYRSAQIELVVPVSCRDVSIGLYARNALHGSMSCCQRLIEWDGTWTYDLYNQRYTPSKTTRCLWGLIWNDESYLHSAIKLLDEGPSYGNCSWRCCGTYTCPIQLTVYYFLQYTDHAYPWCPAYR